MVFFAAVAIDGALAGAIYALIAVAFVLLYKSSRMINFAVGEWVMSGALLAGAGTYALALGPGGALLFAMAAMAGFGVAFNAVVMRRLARGPVVALVMVTLGLGMLMRGVATLFGDGIPAGIRLPLANDPILLGDIPIAPEKLAGALVAAGCIGAVTWAYGHSRTGIALRAIADDPQAAAAAGIDVHRQFALVWAASGAVSAIAGVLWVLVAGGGFGVTLVGLKVFPIVIIGGLDSIPGTIIAAMLIGLVESLGAAYLDPLLGGGCGTVMSYVLLLAMLAARPHGLFGRIPAERV